MGRRPTQLIEISEHAPVAIFVTWGPEYIVTMVNRQACALWGRLLPALLGRPLLAAVPELRGQEFEALLKRVLIGGEVARANELPVDVVRNGQLETRYVTFSVTPTDAFPSSAMEIGVIALECPQGTARG